MSSPSILPENPVTQPCSSTYFPKPVEIAPPLFIKSSRGNCNCKDSDLYCLIDWFIYRESYKELNNQRFGYKDKIYYDVVEDLQDYAEILFRLRNGQKFSTSYRTIQSRIKTLIKHKH